MSLHYKFGWQGKSIGFKCTRKEGDTAWCKISSYKDKESAELCVKKINLLNILKSVDKPLFYETLILKGKEEFWTASIMSYIESKTVSDQQYISQDAFLIKDELFINLRKQVENLFQQQSEVIAFRQELITRRVQERTNEYINTNITKWGTVHGDFHWLNITTNGTLLDWDSWGNGPYGIDIAFLYAFSLANDAYRKNIEFYFNDFFEDRDFLICLLFVCSELSRMIDLYNDHPILKGPLLILEKVIQRKLIFNAKV
jgi:hypothetical protein